MRWSRLFLAGLLGIAAGGVTTLVSTPAQGQVQAGDPCAGLVQWPLYVAGEPADVFVARLRTEGAEVEAFVRSLGIDSELDSLYALLLRINEAPGVVQDDVPEALQGIAGFTTGLVLTSLLSPEDEPSPPLVIRGKIRDYTFVRDPASGLPGKGSGHLSVDICTDIDGFVPVGVDRREFFHWDLEVVEDGFIVNTRTEPSDPDVISTYMEPFGGISLVLPEMTWSPASPHSVWRRGLDHKLHSRGQWIRVTDVYHRKLVDPDLVRLDDNDRLCQVTDASCIDLFTAGPPPGTFGELTNNDYCLGRCAHPPIVNSGD